jgi:antibiotic biosynthesis monooxygenase (ABM) superfamily enzyme
MYGTVARARIKPENRQAFLDAISMQEQAQVPGYRKAWVMFPDQGDEVVFAVFFQDFASYWANAEDPAQDERYRSFRQHLESDPEWTDGEWLEGPDGTA